MASFDPIDAGILNQRGFKPASGYAPIQLVYSHRVDYPQFKSFQTPDQTPPVLLDLGIYGNFVQGDKNGTYDIWFSDIESGDSSYPAHAKGIRATVTNPVIDGVQEGRVFIQYLDENGSVLSGGESTVTTQADIMGSLIPRMASNCYLTIIYRTDINPAQLEFGIKFSLFHKETIPLPPWEKYVLDTDKAVLEGVQGTFRPNEPWYQWFMGLKDDPWYDPDSQAKESTTGGGGGGLYRPCDYVGIPPLPSLDICDSNFVSIYQVDAAGLTALGQWMWDPSWESSLIKNVTDPMQNIISFCVVPLADELETVSDTIQIGNKKSAISAGRLTRSLYEKDFGTVDIKELGRSFYDYSPFTKLQIYLPWIGKRQLNPDDYMDGKIHLVYQFDVYTGQCIAHLQALKDGKTYVVDSYNGNIAAQYPLTGANYLSAYQASLNGLMTMASGGMSGNLGGVLNGAMQFSTAKPTYEKTGTLSGNSGRYGVKTPYVFFDSPQFTEAKEYRHMHGYPSNVYESLSACTGFVSVKYMDLTDAPIPEQCKDRILDRLKAGVHIH